MLKGVGETLVDLRGGSGQPVVQRRGQGAPNQSHRVGALAHSGPDVALQAEDPRLQIDPPCFFRVLLGPREQVERGAEPSGGAEMGRRGQSFLGGVRRQARGIEGGGGLLSRLQGLIPSSPELERRRETAAHLAQPGGVVALPQFLGRLRSEERRVGKECGCWWWAGRATRKN